MSKYLVTGGTGTVGSYLFKELLLHGEEVILIVRGRDQKHAEHRMERIFKFFDLDIELRKNMKIYRGDLLEPHLGLSEDLQREIFSKVDFVIHGASSVRLDLSKRDALEITLRGTEALIELCERWGLNSTLKKIDVISTVGVGGKSFKQLPEEFLRDVPEFHNTYEMGKYRVEEFLQHKIEQGLPITVHRPSMVVGDTFSGKVLEFQVFYFLAELLSGRISYGLLPTFKQRSLDLVPVDYVASGIRLISQDLTTVGRVFHLCTGPSKSLTLDEISEEVRSIYHKYGVKLPTIKKLPTEFIQLLIRLMLYLPIGSIKRKIKALPHYLKYLQTEQEFLNDKSSLYLREKGIEVSSIKDELPKIMQYYLRHKGMLK